MNEELIIEWIKISLIMFKNWLLLIMMCLIVVDNVGNKFKILFDFFKNLFLEVDICLLE